MKLKRKHIVQIICSIVVFVLVFGLVSCSLNKDNTVTEPTDNTEATENIDATESTELPPETTEHIHDYQCNVVEATCTESGYTEYSCICGHRYIDDETKATGHTLGDWEVAVKATCENDGSMQRNCKDCEYFENKTISKIDHEYDLVVTEPTCKEYGFTTYTCKVCGDTYEDNRIAPQHKFGDWSVVKNATCTDSGLQERVCSKCHNTEEKTIKALGHDYKETVVDATCQSKGVITYSCKNCDYSYEKILEAISHTFSTWKETKAATCTQTGEKVRECQCGKTEKMTIPTLGHDTISHDAKSASCESTGWNAYVTCSRCDYTTYKEIPALGHSYVKTVIAATCTEKGYDEYKCSRCEDSYRENYTNTVAHDMGEWEEVESSTCIKEGKEVRKCKNCEYSEIKVKQFRDHDYEMVVTNPTCTEEGYTTCTCRDCGDVVIINRTVPRGHKFQDWKVSIVATCTKAGQEKRWCSCGETEYREIDPMGHDEIAHPAQEATCKNVGWNAYVTCSRCDYTTYQELPKTEHKYTATIESPTCTEQGYTLHTCSVCGDSYKDNFIKAGHVFGSWYTYREATCKEDGIYRRDCENCDHYEAQKTEKLEHNYEPVISKPTCTEDGYTTYTCTGCGDTYVDDIVTKTGHSYGDWILTKESTCKEEGEETKTCEVCGNAEHRSVSKKDHEYVVTVVEPTCTENGYNLYTCKCGDFYKDGEVLASHKYGDWYVYTDTSCVTAGEERRDCKNCDAYDSRPIPTVDHACTAEVIEPTCTEQGYTIFTCSCGYSEISDYTDMIPHDYEESIIEPSCKEEGYTLHTCAMCGDFYTDNVTERTEHGWGDWSIKTPATVLNTGVEIRTCSSCGTEEERVIDKLKLDERIVAYYTIVDGNVIDIISGKTMENAVIDGNYFKGGKVVLPATYETYTIETIMVYNRNSTENPISENFAYYGGALKFQEIETPSNWHYIKTPFGGGQIWTDFTLRPSLNYNTRVFSDGESYWAFTVDSAGSYSVQINDNYVNKSHWASAIRKTFTLSADHEFKEFIVYSTVLSQEELAENFADKNIDLHAENDTLVGRVTNGITHLGSAFAFTQTGRYGVPELLKTSVNAGNYSVNDNNGTVLNYTISDYVEPDLGIDHSKYESVHIINEPDTLYLDYKYALSAVPYPFNVNHNGNADQYDVSWKSSDETIAVVIDGLVIPKKTGTVTITATLRGTEMSDSCTIKIIAKENVADKVFNVPADYVSANGNSFSDTNYTMTANAIYDVIDEAYFAGYNHVVFPQIDFYAAPTGTTYYIPTGMTVEFPEGSAFYMMPSDIAKTDGYTFFQMGGGWWSCGVPANKSYKKTDADGNVLAYYCKDAHLIIDKYYGEFYKADATMAELNTGANEYAWGCVLLSMGKRAEYCSVEIREANCPTGFFILMGGKGNNEMINAAGGTIAANKFVSGWLDDTGTIVENSNWISTPDFYTVSPGAANGMDTLHEYYLGDWEHNVITATQHLYDILWFDENKELIQINRWQYVDEGYSNKPTGAKYFKISMQQSELPTGTDFYIGLYPDEATKFCEIKNTNVINGADGLASVVGATEACWIHDNYVSGDGLLSGACWALDLEDGWMGMRGTIIERNILRKYAYSASHGEYRGPDSGILALASGYNTFVISNYLGAVQQSNYNVANTHIINNVIHSMYSSFSGGKPNELRTKINAHVYYNILGQTSNVITANGVVYYNGNTITPTVNLW